MSVKNLENQQFATVDEISLSNFGNIIQPFLR